MVALLILYPIHTDNDSNRRFSPIGTRTEDVRENIYDLPHTHASVECSSPPPTGPEYYNQSVILRNKRSQYDAEAGALVLVPPSAAVKIKPTPPPKPKRPTKDDTGTPFSSLVLMGKIFIQQFFCSILSLKI